MKIIFLRKALFPWMAVAAWATLIFFLSAQHSLATNFGFWDVALRKAAHVTEYAVLTLLLWNALRVWAMAAGLTLAFAAATSFLYACSDEFHQTFVPGRTGTPRDVAIDSGGIALMTIFILLMRSKGRSRTGVHV